MKEDLWSSKALDLIWLPASPLWHCPSLHRASSGAWEWFWRVDVTFGAWATRTMAKARSAGAMLPGDPESGLRIIRAYLDELKPGSLSTVDTLTSSPVSLPGAELIRDATEFARFGMVPSVM